MHITFCVTFFLLLEMGWSNFERVFFVFCFCLVVCFCFWWGCRKGVGGVYFLPWTKD